MTKRMGLGAEIHGIVNQQYKAGGVFTADNFKIPNASRKQVSATLCRLVTKKLLVNGPIKGQYRIARSGKQDVSPEEVVIENLLNAMAAAEPVLRKWSRVHEALKGI